MGRIFKPKGIITIKEKMKMEDKELTEMIELINKRVTIEVSALTIERISNNLTNITTTLESTVNIFKMLVANDMQLQEQIKELENELGV